MAKIEISKLSKSDKKNILLEDFSHQFNSGEVSAVASENFDASKTMFEILTGHTKLDDGSVLIDGQAVHENRKKLANQISYLSVDERHGLRGTVNEVLDNVFQKNTSNISKDQVTAILKQLDIHLIEPVDGLEIGRLQQFKIVIEIAKGKSVFLLEYPTSQMNSKQQTQIWQLLRDFAKKTKATIIFSSESVAEMQKFADEIIYVANGKLRHVQKQITHDTTDCLVTVKGSGFPVSLAEKLGSFVIQEADNEIKFIFSGNIQALLPLLEQSTITDVRINDVSIKEELMRF